ncbi:hypothetical protein Tco_0858029 [Tanacetum coccineum]|uniref:Uncharacterized protein n=1 Tax=Tanacetum coccineum TaxID=301880 RepID=A0ABQ5BAP7_9ASTR
MAAAAMKHMGSNFSKLDKFKGIVVMMQLWNKSGRRPSRIMMTMSAEAKYMAEDASSKKFLVSNFTNYKMADSRPVLEQYNELLGILGRFTQHKMNIDEAIQSSVDSDKLKGHSVIDHCWWSIWWILDKFKRVDFRRWQKKMHFLLFSMSVVYVPTTLIPEDDESATME